MYDQEEIFINKLKKRPTCILVEKKMMEISIDLAVFASLCGGDLKQECKYLVDGEENLDSARRKKLTVEKRIEKNGNCYTAKIKKINK